MMLSFTWEGGQGEETESVDGSWISAVDVKLSLFFQPKTQSKAVKHELNKLFENLTAASSRRLS